MKNIHFNQYVEDTLSNKEGRINGEIRDRKKVMRGMNTAESSQKLIESMRVYYAFCRDHSSLGKTLVEQAGIKLELGNNKIENLIRLSNET